jgi:hypothetical protein
MCLRGLVMIQYLACLSGYWIMGKTVELYRMALYGEINCWNGFARALHKPDREALASSLFSYS